MSSFWSHSLVYCVNQKLELSPFFRVHIAENFYHLLVFNKPVWLASYSFASSPRKFASGKLSKANTWTVVLISLNFELRNSLDGINSRKIYFFKTLFLTKFVDNKSLCSSKYTNFRLSSHFLYILITNNFFSLTLRVLRILTSKIEEMTISPMNLIRT